MKMLNRILLIALIGMMAFLLVNCGDEEASDPTQVSQPGNQQFSQDCSQLISNFNGFNPIPYNGYAPNAGEFLTHNPNTVFRDMNGHCVSGYDIFQQYSDYSRQQGYGYTPWHLYNQSPYSKYQMNTSYNSSANWTSSGEFFGAIPGYPRGDQWQVRFDYWNQPAPSKRGRNYYNEDDGWGFDFGLLW